MNVQVVSSTNMEVESEAAESSEETSGEPAVSELSDIEDQAPFEGISADTTDDNS